MKAKLGAFLLMAVAIAAGARAERPFDFDRDTFDFANMTVFAYENGVPHLRHGDEAKQERYTRRCFVLSRSVWQFRKFARFDAHAPPIGDQELVARIRQVTRRAAWKPALPENKRVVFPYADLRALSEKHGRLLQENTGKGWPTYWRPGNWRVFFAAGRGYQEQTHEHLNEALARNDMFVGYLTTLPNLSINHAVLFYSRKADPKQGIDHYLVYDSNHPEAPRHLTWSDRERSFSYEKDWDFVGGNVRVYQVYGKAFQ